MKTTIRTSWIQNHPAMAIDEQGFSNIISLTDRARADFLLPDEVEDYMNVSIKSVKAHVHVNYLDNITNGSEGYISCYSGLFIITQTAADSTISTAHSAKANGLSAEEYINANVTGDSRRAIEFITKMKNWQYKSTIAYSSTTAHFCPEVSVDFWVDLTKVFQMLLKIYESSDEEANVPKCALCMYTDSGHCRALSPGGDSNSIFLEIDWDYKSNRNSPRGIVAAVSRSSSNNSGSGSRQIVTGPGYFTSILNNLFRIKRAT